MVLDTTRKYFVHFYFHLSDSDTHSAIANVSYLGNVTGDNQPIFEYWMLTELEDPFNARYRRPCQSPGAQVYFIEERRPHKVIVISLIDASYMANGAILVDSCIGEETSGKIGNRSLKQGYFSSRIFSAADSNTIMQSCEDSTGCFFFDTPKNREYLRYIPND